MPLLAHPQAHIAKKRPATAKVKDGKAEPPAKATKKGMKGMKALQAQKLVQKEATELDASADKGTATIKKGMKAKVVKGMKAKVVKSMKKKDTAKQVKGTTTIKQGMKAKVVKGIKAKAKKVTMKGPGEKAVSVMKGMKAKKRPAMNHEPALKDKLCRADRTVMLFCTGLFLQKWACSQAEVRSGWSRDFRVN